MGYKEVLEANKEEMVAFMQTLLSLPSVKAEPQTGAPFGSGIRRTLDFMLSYAKRLGFDVHNVDGYAGYAETGEGEETLGILVHLDVVPEGSGWTYKPFAGTINNGRIYGRGALDNKGPASAVLFALKSLMDTCSFNKKVRIIFGCDEESGWADMDYYEEKCGMPDIGFAPDAVFPVVNAEKGILHLNLDADFDEYHLGYYRLTSLTGGDRVNVIPDSARAELVAVTDTANLRKALLEYTNKHDAAISMLESGREITLISRGRSGHASRPEDGDNAIVKLLGFLSTLDLGTGDLPRFVSFAAEAFAGSDGSGLHINMSDEPSGALTLNLGNINLDEKHCSAGIDIRYPVTANSERIIAAVEDRIKALGMKQELDMHHKPLYIPKEHELVKTLCEVYREHTGDMSEPVAMGGGTYARALKTGVAFGPVSPHMKACEHQADEYIEIDDLYECAEIYADAIKRLACR